MLQHSSGTARLLATFLPYRTHSFYLQIEMSQEDKASPAKRICVRPSSRFDVSETSDEVVGKRSDRYTKMNQAGVCPDADLARLYSVVVQN